MASKKIDIVVEFRGPVRLKCIDLVEYLENLFEAKMNVLILAGINNIRIKAIAENIK